MEKERPLVGIIVNEADQPYLAGALYYMQQEFFKANIDVAIFSSLMTIDDRKFTEAENEIFHLINFDLLDGIVLFPASFYDLKTKQEIITQIRLNFSKPVICIDEEISGFDSDAIEDPSGAEQLLEHLVMRHNVTDAVFVTLENVRPVAQKLQEYILSLSEEIGCPIDNDKVFKISGSDRSYDELVDTLTAKQLPQAIMCCNDLVAVNIIRKLADRGFGVPNDVIVTGYCKSEPRIADYFNITTVQRNQKPMSVYVARKLVGQILQGDMVTIDFEDTYSLIPGFSCGCRPLDLKGIAAGAIDYRPGSTINREHFDSYYNFMSEMLMEADSFDNFLQTLQSHAKYLDDVQGFWLCLNDGVMRDPHPAKEYTDNIYIPYEYVDGMGDINHYRCFPKEQMLAPIFEKREKPQAYIFTSLHFLGLNYGYTVLSYGDSGRVYNEHYVKWLRKMTCALENQRKHLIYSDTIMDTQVRDSLTGLLNVRGYTRIMTERAGKFDDPDKVLRVISIDVENLKGVNETYGHAEGDRMLERLAAILTVSAGEGDLCVRVTGDEFFIAGIMSSAEDFDDVPKNLEYQIQAYNSSSDRDYSINLHMARVVAPLTGVEVIANLPYEAEYQRSMQKRNDQKMQRKLKSDADISAADQEERNNVIRIINENLFTYVFQPIIDARTGDIFAYEALMRSGSKYKISPLTILNHAEDIGRLGDIERLTLFNTLEVFKKHRDLFGKKKLFINCIPAFILSDADFEQLYSLYGDIMDQVVLEFTEQTEMSPSQLAVLLKRSKRTNYQIAIDDYGTGYSNISSLLNFMPNYVKVDRSLISNIHTDRRKRHFTKNIIDYAHDNNFLVLAEGVEKPEEMATVIAMDFDLIQGYYTACPTKEIIPEIPFAIRSEIDEANRARGNQRVQKTFFTRDDMEMSIAALEFENYTDIMVTKKNFTLIGNREMDSSIAIHIMDNTECTVHLKDIMLREEGTGNTISLGMNSKLTLDIQGEVNIHGSIKVPEHSELTIVGDGLLNMLSASERQYIIGHDLSHSHGKITLQLNNTMRLHMDSANSIVVGAGSNESSNPISIRGKELIIEQTGRDAIGIGSHDGKAIVHVENTKLSYDSRCSTSACIGGRGIEVHLMNSDVDIVSFGDRVCGITTFAQSGSSVAVFSTKIKAIFRGKEVFVIGGPDSILDTAMIDSTFDIAAEGAYVIGFGSSSKRGSVSFYRCGGHIDIRSGNGALFGVPEDKVEQDVCDIVFESTV